MCFSASASFIASAVTATAGVASIKKTKKKNELLVASVPILFSMQQFIEGIQWLLDKPSFCSDLFGYGFLFFAFLLWPFYIPFSLFWIEPDKKRKKILKWFASIGAFCSIFSLVMLLINPITIAEVQHSLVYGINIPIVFTGLFVYVLATCGSTLVSSFKILRLFGVLSFVFWLISILFYSYAFTSVWCFFASILSVIIYLHFTKYESKK